MRISEISLFLWMQRGVLRMQWEGGWEYGRVGLTWSSISKEYTEGIRKERKTGESLGERTRASGGWSTGDKTSLHFEQWLGKQEQSQVDLVLRAGDKHAGCEDAPLPSSCDMGWRSVGQSRPFFSWSASFGLSGQQLVGEGATLGKQNLLNRNPSFWSPVVFFPFPNW